MSDSIVPIPTSITTLTPDRRSRRDRSTPEDVANPEMPAEEPVHREVARVGASSESEVGADTLFTASVFGQRMRSIAADLSALQIKRGQSWSPPESGLRLKDKSI